MQDTAVIGKSSGGEWIGALIFVEFKLKSRLKCSGNNYNVIVSKDALVFP